MKQNRTLNFFPLKRELNDDETNFFLKDDESTYYNFIIIYFISAILLS